MNGEEITGELLEYGCGWGGPDFREFPLNEFKNILFTRLGNLECLANLGKGLELLFHPFVTDTYNRVTAGIFLENTLEFHETALISYRHSINFIKYEAEITGSLGTKKVGHIAAIQKGYQGFLYGGFMAMLRGVPFNYAVSGGLKGGMGQGRFTDAWGSV